MLSGRKVIGSAMYVALFTSWVIPVSFVASLTTLEALSERLPFLEFVTDLNSVVKAFLQGFLPTLALMVFLIILPMLLNSISRFEGITSYSGIDIKLVEKFFLFQVGAIKHVSFTHSLPFLYSFFVPYFYHAGSKQTFTHSLTLIISFVHSFSRCSTTSSFSRLRALLWSSSTR
jgi:hypothetical protein